MKPRTEPVIERQQRLASSLEGANINEALAQAMRMVDELGEESVDIIQLKKYTSFSFAEIGDDAATGVTGWSVVVSNWKDTSEDE